MNDEYVSPCGRAAVEYIGKGLAVLPLKPRSKEPATKNGSSDWGDDIGQAQVWWDFGELSYKHVGNPDFNVGIVCGQVSGGVIAIDIDIHGDVDGTATLKDWETAHGKLPETWTQITGSGGKQLFYRASREIRPSVNDKIGIDIRGDGSYVVAPPSLHPCGEYYEWSISPDDMEIADADDRVYAFIDYVRPHGSGLDGKPKERFFLPDEIDHPRNETLFKYGCSLREKGLSDVEISDLLHLANSTRCKPPLSEAELNKIIRSVCGYAPGNSERKAKLPAAIETSGGGVSIFDRPDEPAKRISDETVDKVKSILLGLAEIDSNIKYNVFDSRLHVLGECIPGCPFDSPHVLTEGESINLLTVLERDYGVRNKGKFLDALTGFGSLDDHQYNPMKDLLGTLPVVRFADEGTAGCTGATISISYDRGKTWQASTAIAGSLCYEYLDVEPSTYTMEVEKLMFRQLVARALHPGCKADHMVLFVGKQGTGKSTFVRLLALDPEFFLEGFSNFDTEDLKRIVGKLVVEIPELDGFNGKDKNRIKSIITQATDTYRESYARTSSEHQRTALFFGTTNDGTFLNDETGSRRFLVLESGCEQQGADPRLFDGTAAADIRQAWAETLALYRMEGEGEFLKSLRLPPETAREAFEVQEKYSEESAIKTSVMTYIEDREAEIKAAVEAKRMPNIRTSVKQVMVEAMGYDDFKMNTCPKWIINSVTSTLNSCQERGWKRVERGRNGKYGIARAWDFQP